jgi:hypothetical protein
MVAIRARLMADMAHFRMSGQPARHVKMRCAAGKSAEVFN